MVARGAHHFENPTRDYPGWSVQSLGYNKGISIEAVEVQLVDIHCISFVPTFYDKSKGRPIWR